MTGLQTTSTSSPGLDRQAVPDHRLDRPVQSLSHDPKAIASTPRPQPKPAATIPVPAGVAQLVRAAES